MAMAMREKQLVQLGMMVASVFLESITLSVLAVQFCEISVWFSFVSCVP